MNKFLSYLFLFLITQAPLHAMFYTIQKGFHYRMPDDITVDTHIKKNPEIAKPKNITILLESVKNDADQIVEIINGDYKSSLESNQKIICGKNLNLSSLNNLFPIPNNGFIKDRLETVFFKGAHKNAYLNTWVNKTSNILELILIRLDDQDRGQFPPLETKIPLDNQKLFSIAVVLAGKDFEKSSIKVVPSS